MNVPAPKAHDFRCEGRVLGEGGKHHHHAIPAAPAAFPSPLRNADPGNEVREGVRRGANAVWGAKAATKRRGDTDFVAIRGRLPFRQNCRHETMKWQRSDGTQDTTCE